MNWSYQEAIRQYSSTVTNGCAFNNCGVSGYNAGTGNELRDIGLFAFGTALKVGEQTIIGGMAAKQQAQQAAVTAAQQESAKFATATSGADTAIASYNTAKTNYDSAVKTLNGLEARQKIANDPTKQQELRDAKRDLEALLTAGPNPQGNNDKVQKYNNAKADCDALNNLKTELGQIDQNIATETAKLDGLRGSKPSTSFQGKIQFNIPDASEITNGAVASQKCSELTNKFTEYYNSGDASKVGHGFRKTKDSSGNETIEVIESCRANDNNTVTQIVNWITDVGTSNQNIAQYKNDKKNAINGVTLNDDSLKPAEDGSNLEQQIAQAKNNMNAANTETLSAPDGSKYTGLTPEKFEQEKTKLETKIAQMEEDITPDGKDKLDKAVREQKATVESKRTTLKATQVALTTQRDSLQIQANNMSSAAQAEQRLSQAQSDLATDRNTGKDGGKRTGWQKFWGVNKGKAGRHNIKQDKQNVRSASTSYATAQAELVGASGYSYSAARLTIINDKISKLNTAIAELAKIPNS